MTTRNYYLEQILTAEGGTPTPGVTRDDLLNAIVVAGGGSVTLPNNMHSLLNDYLVAKGGERIDDTRNKIIEGIITQIGGSFPENDTRNSLLILWEAAI